MAPASRGRSPSPIALTSSWPRPTPSTSISPLAAIWARASSYRPSYVGRLSRHSLVERDLAMPTNLMDPASGQTYFQAMSTLMSDIDFKGMNANTIPAIPFFQNMWPGAGGNGLTPTQVWANDYVSNSATGDATNTLNNADNAANCVNGGPTTFTSKGAVNHIACGKYGPWMVFNPQFSALSAWSSHRERRLPRAAGDPAQTLQLRIAIRRELHLVEVDRPWLGPGKRRLVSVCAASFKTRGTRAR